VTDAAREPVVLFASEDIVVVDKPPGIATEPDRRGESSLRDWVGANVARAGTPHAVSRLDVGVSGAVTFALSSRAKVAAAKAKEAGRFERRYVAVVGPADSARHLPTAGLDATGEVTAPVEGKPARTRYRTIATAGAARVRVSVVVFSPLTGRTHQIRIHAASLGAPIVGDRRYGGRSSIPDAKGRVHAVERVLLHALAVRPVLGLPTDPVGFVTAPLPAAFVDLWRALDGAPEAWKDVGECVDGSVPGS
jgi:23S rRNA-/tRNA-specific pseudouridylate synthase